jgi:hypothetical protein
VIKPCSAVKPATGTAAASSNERFAGLRSTTGWRRRIPQRPAVAAVHLVAGLEVFDCVADRLDDSGEVAAELAHWACARPSARPT